MGLNESKGNMYGAGGGINITHTWNTVKGKCPHGCSYCYMKAWPQSELHFDEKELSTDLSKAKFVFVGSSCDMFASTIPEDWISRTLEHCRKFEGVKYLFQSKNPENMYRFSSRMPIGSVLGTTIETNRQYFEIMGNSPYGIARARALLQLKKRGFETMVTIEPILDFDLLDLVEIIRIAGPKWVNIGADSRNLNLPKPSREKVSQLVEELKTFTTVLNKNNLGRLL